MKQREQALLLLRRAAQDESLLDEVLASSNVSDELIGFHCQQAAEKMLKALLSDLGVAFRKTHELGALMDLIARSGEPLPHEFEDLDALTPFGAVYRYDDYDAENDLDRRETRALLRSLRLWVEGRLARRAPKDDHSAP
jgi:HEPN domain-containing protein